MSSCSAVHSWQPPGLILSSRPFLGVSSVSKEADLDCLVRFSRPENGASVVTAAVRHGVGAIAPMNDATLLQALDLARASCNVQVYPVIPNVLGYVRDATDYGMLGAGIRHVKRLRVGDLLRIGLRGLASLRGVMAREFNTLLSLLIEVEMVAFKRFRPPLVLLHSQVTDLMVAFKNQEALRAFAEVIPTRFGARPGVVTNNFGALLRFLTRSKIDIPVIVAPFNPRGFLMKPTKLACESLLEETNAYVIADRIADGDVESLNGVFEYVHGLGIRSAMVDIADAAAVDALVAGRYGGGDEQRATSG
jgi:hypothetical protein